MSAEATWCQLTEICFKRNCSCLGFGMQRLPSSSLNTVLLSCLFYCPICPYFVVCTCSCRLPELESQFGVDPALLTEKGPHILASIAVMSVPGLIAWGADSIMRLAYNSSHQSPAAPRTLGGTAVLSGASLQQGSSITPFLNLSYGYLPLVWGATLAHYLQPFLEEAGNILPVTASTFHLDGSGLPVITADHAVTQFLQVTCQWTS